MKILIVEDEPKVLELLQGFFIARGHEVLTSQTGTGAVEQIGQSHPDIVLLDWWLKDRVSGQQVLQETKQRSPNSAVIVITGFEDVSPEQILKLGGYALLKKPVALDQLDALVRQARQPEASP